MKGMLLDLILMEIIKVLRYHVSLIYSLLLRKQISVPDPDLIYEFNIPVSMIM